MKNDIINYHREVVGSHKYVKVGLLNHISTYLNFSETVNFFSKVAVTISNAWGFLLHPILTNRIVVVVVVVRYSNRLVVIIHCGFNLLFPSDWWYWTSLHVCFAIHIFSLVKSVLMFCLFFNWMVCFHIIKCWRSFIYSLVNTLSPSGVCLFILAVSSAEKSFYLWSKIVNCAFGTVSKKPFPKPRLWIYYLRFLQLYIWRLCLLYILS